MRAICCKSDVTCRDGGDQPPDIALAWSPDAADTGRVSCRETARTDDRIAAIVLAAGESKRFGTTKQLARFKGVALVARAVRLAESACGSRTLLVTGRDWKRVHDASAPLRGFLVRNDRYADGLGTSLACGVRSLRQQIDAVLVLLADQPLIGPDYIARLLQAWRDDGRRYACSRYGDMLGPPAIFPRDAFGDLQALHGDRGARAVLEAHVDELTVLDCPEGSTDVDTPEDLAAIAAGE